MINRSVYHYDILKSPLCCWCLGQTIVAAVATVRFLSDTLLHANSEGIVGLYFLFVKTLFFVSVVLPLATFLASHGWVRSATYFCVRTAPLASYSLLDEVLLAPLACLAKAVLCSEAMDTFLHFVMGAVVVWPWIVNVLLSPCLSNVRVTCSV